jgi:hypothetical protein
MGKRAFKLSKEPSGSLIKRLTLSSKALSKTLPLIECIT